MSFLSYCKKMLNIHEDYKAYRVEYIDNGIIWKTRYIIGSKISNKIKEFVDAGAAKLTDITESVRDDNKIT